MLPSPTSSVSFEKILSPWSPWLPPSVLWPDHCLQMPVFLQTAASTFHYSRLTQPCIILTICILQTDLRRQSDPWWHHCLNLRRNDAPIEQSDPQGHNILVCDGWALSKYTSWPADMYSCLLVFIFWVYFYLMDGHCLSWLFLEKKKAYQSYDRPQTCWSTPTLLPETPAPPTYLPMSHCSLWVLLPYPTFPYLQNPSHQNQTSNLYLKTISFDEVATLFAPRKFL